MPTVYLSKTQERQARATKILKVGIVEQNTDQKALAKKIGMTHGTVNKRVNMPETATLGELWKILDGLEMPLEERAKILM